MRKLKKTCVAVVSVCLSLSNLCGSAFAIPKNKWTKEEDRRLLSFVKSTYGNHEGKSINWQLISSHMVDRSARQCSDRYNNYLSPYLINGEWSAEEDNALVLAVKNNGTHWKIISRLFPGRGINNIKNRYNKLLRRNPGLLDNYEDKNVVTKQNDISLETTDSIINIYDILKSFEDDVYGGRKDRFIDDFDFEEGV